MRRILVTGANKGIGFAIAERILEEADDTFVFLGSRDLARGNTAAESLSRAGADRADRIRVVELDVSSDVSVDHAARKVREACGGDKLYGIVNNAGIGLGTDDLRSVLNVNTRGVQRVCDAFIPLLSDGGRIVNITSAAGPNFVATCSEDRQAFFKNPAVTWEEIEALMEECTAIAGDSGAFASRGLGDGSPYGLSKACANAYTLHLARAYPQFIINACTPGFIATDLTRPYASGRGKTPEELGMKSPREGANTPIFLLFGTPDSSGHYYGSDAKRSPLDRYREPGSPPYTGD
ncbi:SDR family NAD(P)-dependent oxidoreductase [Tropicimonas sp. IMCC6043]|uniref:SDR family NAD(P)-dependent oxidoreductase n=1 Tax=Tropicimonas sp. IMCC6043 TaxID=2510645 RepID=UPI00101C4386|nr:SDR family NAD(P)-dependent oxidoreductase [Tropicimonas sp. IMCC6043]RYH07364.1 SDR family NAD(P)-dependent oxidoreductase [Tropicimonas sp. IMCC6043]